MIGELVIPPGLLMVLGAWGLLLLPRRMQAAGAVVLPVLSLGLFLLLPAGGHITWQLFGVSLEMVFIDGFSRLFGFIFHVAAILSAIFALHVRDPIQHLAAMVYGGAAIGACCAGELVSLFVYWELTALSSVFLIWAAGSPSAYRAGMRYLIIQVGSGVLLLAGIILQYAETGLLTFGSMTDEVMAYRPGALLILVAFGIKAAFPLLHNWLQDAYPEATPTGTVYLSGFTTKLAIYALARGFAGLEPLIWIGCVMTLFPILFAVIENDLRRVLSYSLNNQLGFMVVGIGIGTELALNGTAAHAFCHIIYKALLFMSMGAVLHRVGTCKATELGGLHHSMPWTTWFCVIGAGAISGFPLLSGFISKSMIISAAGETHRFWVWIVLLIASAGVMEHSGIKIPFFAFFGHDSGKRPPEAPRHMLVAMGLAAALCIGLGVGYPLLYQWLPYEADYHPYTVTHCVTQLQLLLFAALAFVFLMRTGLYPDEKRAINLDFDWVYRRAAPQLVSGGALLVRVVDRSARRLGLQILRRLLQAIGIWFSERGFVGRTWTTGTMAFWAGTLLATCLLLYYL